MIRRKYFKRLFFIYISFTLVYGFILTSFFVYQNKNNLEVQEINNKVNYANQMARNIDQRVASLLKYVDTLYLDSDFKEYLINDGDYYSITRIYEKLRRDMSVFSDLGARITLTKYVDDLFITNQATMDPNEFYHTFSFTTEEQKLVNQFYETSDNREYYLFNDSNKINIVMMTVNKYSTKNKLLVIQTITTENIEPIDDTEHLEVIILGDTDIEKNKYDNSYKIEDEHIQVTRKSTIIPSIVYIIDLPYSKQSFAAQQYIVGISIYLLIVSIGSIVAALFARSTYRPIESIMKSFDEEEGTKDDEFAFLSRITQDIKHANEHLKTTISENKLDLKTKFIRELIHGLVPESDADEGINTYHLNNLSESPQIILFKVQELDATFENYLSDARNSIGKSVFTILEKALAIEGGPHELTELNYDIYGLIVSDWDETELKKMLSKIISSVEVEEGLDIVVIIGEQVDTIYRINLSYQSCLSILDYRSSFDKRAIINTSDMEELVSSDVYVFPVDLERELIIYTLQGVNNQVDQIFNRLYKLNFIEKTMKEQENRNLIMALIGTMRRVHLKIQLKNDEDELEMSRVFENNRYEVEELFQHIKIIFLNYCDIVKKRSQTKAIEYSTEMIEFIHEHYHEDISLEAVSSHLNLSTGYFSTIFKKETGENFKGYLNKYRAQKATEIIKANTNIRIKDLAIQVGYYNVNSFIRMFKKYEGVSPGEYAKNVK